MHAIRISILFILATTQSFAQSGSDETFKVKRYTVADKPRSVVLENILMDQMKPLGEIKGSYLSASFYRNDDLVYLRLNNPNVSVGDRFMIYEDRGPVSVPGRFQKEMGRDVFIKGYAEVTKVVSEAVIARLYDCGMNVGIGDKIMDLIDTNISISPQEPRREIQGVVLRSAKNLGLIGPYDFVYLNKGSKDGLELNDRLYVQRKAELIWGASDKEKKPPVNIAELVLVHLGKEVSTAYVLGADDHFAPGSVFKSAISEVKFLNEKKASSEVEAAQTSQNESSVSTKSDASTEESFESEIDIHRSYFSFAPGVMERIDRDGIHRPFFSLLFEGGSDRFALPLKLSIVNQGEQEFELGFLMHWNLQPWPKHPRLSLSLGAGPQISYIYTHTTKMSASNFAIGGTTKAEARYYFSDKLFFLARPAEMALYFWQYQNSEPQGFKSTSESKFDFAARIQTFFGLGFQF